MSIMRGMTPMDFLKLNFTNSYMMNYLECGFATSLKYVVSWPYLCTVVTHPHTDVIWGYLIGRDKATENHYKGYIHSLAVCYVGREQGVQDYLLAKFNKTCEWLGCLFATCRTFIRHKWTNIMFNKNGYIFHQKVLGYYRRNLVTNEDEHIFIRRKPLEHDVDRCSAQPALVAEIYRDDWNDSIETVR